MKCSTLELHGYFRFANQFICHKSITTLVVPTSNNKFVLLQSTEQGRKQICSIDQHYLDKAIQKSHEYVTRNLSIQISK